MKSFKDANDRQWEISITFDALKRVKAFLGVELDKPSLGDPPLLASLTTDVILLCDVIYCICAPQAKAENVSDEDFGRGLDGNAIFGAMNAFMEEWVDFFQKRRRPDEAKAVNKQMMVLTKAIEAAEKYVDSPELDKKIDAELAKIVKTSLLTPIGSQESSVSIPDR